MLLLKMFITTKIPAIIVVNLLIRKTNMVKYNYNISRKLEI